MPERTRSLYPCRSGHHTWFNAADAEKCCDPLWRRILVVGDVRGATNIIAEGNTLLGRRWVRVDDAREQNEATCA
jgi:hypothetical protein